MIIPTILEKDPEEIINKVTLLNTEAKHFQIDIVDPKLFDGETVINLDFLSSIPSDITIELDLMVEDPSNFLSPNLRGVKKIAANILGQNIENFVYKSTEYGYLTGISINPDTPDDQYDALYDGIDFIQFLGVIPGAQGRVFDNKIIEKIQNFTSKYPDIPVQVDGGLDESHIKKLKTLGVTGFAVGSAIFRSADPIETYNKLTRVLING